MSVTVIEDGQVISTNLTAPVNNHCLESSCPDGNCQGCRNGQIWCHDPSCEPYCRGCQPPNNHERVLIFMIIAIIIIVGLIALSIAIGSGHPIMVYHDGDPTQYHYVADRSHGWGPAPIETTD